MKTRVLYQREKSFVLIVAILMISLLYGTEKPQFFFGILACVLGLIYIKISERRKAKKIEIDAIVKHSIEIKKNNCCEVHIYKDGGKKSTHLIEVFLDHKETIDTWLGVKTIASIFKKTGIKFTLPPINT